MNLGSFFFLAFLLASELGSAVANDDVGGGSFFFLLERNMLRNYGGTVATDAAPRRCCTFMIKRFLFRLRLGGYEGSFARRYSDSLEVPELEKEESWSCDFFNFWPCSPWNMRRLAPAKLCGTSARARKFQFSDHSFFSLALTRQT